MNVDRLVFAIAGVCPLAMILRAADSPAAHCSRREAR